MNKKVKFVDSIKDYLSTRGRNANSKYRLKVYLIKYLPILGLFILSHNVIINLLLAVGWWFFATIFFDHRDIKVFNPIIRIWFGVPGSGKTTMAAMLAKNSIDLGYMVLSNVPIKNTYRLEDTDLGNYDMSFGGVGCHTIIDEALVKGLYNRQFKEFAKSNKPLYFSEHRHMNNMIDIFSQGYDIDLNVKQRAGERGLFHISKFPIKGFIVYRRIKKIFFIRKDDKQFLDGFKYIGLPRVLYCRSVWDTFDTNDMTDCPKEQKEWQKWNFEEE